MEKKKCDLNAGKCPMKEALQFLAGAWTVEVYWNLREGPMRFGVLRRSVGASAKVLTDRLRELEEWGVVDRAVKDTFPPQVEYSLTAFGKKFVPILEAIAEVGQGLIRRPRTPKQKAMRNNRESQL
jgi:DNA-binding HxlR family transcriptional regulator